MSRNRYFRDFSDFLSEHLPGKHQKITINAGFTCPNRDGTKGVGGCTYCNNQSFNPEYCRTTPSVTQQITKGKEFFASKYPSMRYLAYFQAYTNTYGDTGRLMALYEEALAIEAVDGLIIATRPDCMPDLLLDALARTARSHFVMVEYGAESAHDTTLERVNRCHTWEHTADAVRRTAAKGIFTGLHLIMGLPGETEDMMLATIDRVNELPVDAVKIHQLQIIRGTRLARDMAEKRCDIITFTPDSYIELCCKIIDRLRSDIAIDRFVSQSPDGLLISPKWGLKNHEFTDRLLRALSRR